MGTLLRYDDFRIGLGDPWVFVLFALGYDILPSLIMIYVFVRAPSKSDEIKSEEFNRPSLEDFSTSKNQDEGANDIGAINSLKLMLSPKSHSKSISKSRDSGSC